MASESSTSRSDGGGGATAESYVGSSISLTSKSEIRYEGVLININTEESSIGLRNVRSLGTEGRRKDGPQVPPSDKIYEYILFRGSDIKDIQVKVSQPAQTVQAINTDPAIIQSHNPRPTIPPASLPAAPSGSLVDLASHNAQMGVPGSTFQSGMPLYQPGGNMNSWAPPPNANGSGVPMPMYWPGFYGTANGMSQLPQHSLLPPPPGLTIQPSMQQMQFSGFNSSLPPPASSLPSSSFPDYNSSLVSNSTSYSSLNATTLPASSFPLNAPPLQPVSLPSETMTNPLPNRAPSFGMPASAPSSSLPSLVPHSMSAPDNAGHALAANKPSAVPSSAAFAPQTISQPLSSVSGPSGSVLTETLAPSLITPGQLLQSGPSTVSVPQPSQKTHKDVEVVQESPKQSPEPPVPAVTEAQPPILPLPPNTRAYKPNGGAYHMRNSYRGRGGRGYGISRPVTKFTEDFDFTAMNEKFNKDEVWGHLGKSTKSQSNDNEGNGNGSDEEDSHYEDDAEFPNVDAKPVYNKDDFFDSLSSNSMDRNVNNNGRPRYSEQMKLDTETFGEFSRYRGGRGGRGGGRFRGSYNGRGNGGYGYMGRGRGRGMQYRAS